MPKRTLTPAIRPLANSGEQTVSEPVSWLLIRRGWIVTSSDGVELGKIGAVRGEPVKDIFNGVVVRPHADIGPRYVYSDLIAEIVVGRVGLVLDAAEFAALPPEPKRPLAPSFTISEFLRRRGLR
jgi:hypothetical protein